MTAASILIVEDEAVTALDLQELLEGAGHQVAAIAATAAEALAAGERRPIDLALVDIRLADGSDGVAVAVELRRRADCAVIFLTAHGDSAIVARAEALSPAAYLLKPFNEREVEIAVRLALAKQASDRALQLSEQRYATTLSSLSDGVIVVDLSDRVVLLNPAAAALTGCVEEEAVGLPFGQVVVMAGPQRDEIAPDDAAWWRLRRPDGSTCDVTYAQAPLVDERGNTAGAVLVLRDVTAQRRAEAEYRQLEQRLQEAQRVESLGIIASSIAHDFNNILAIVGGYTELALAETAPASSAHTFLAEAMRGLGRAGELTRQLLSYAGKVPTAFEALDLNLLLREMIQLMRVATGPRVELSLACADSLPTILGDPTQIRQVVINLLTNAAEAMDAGGGRIAVTTRLVSIGGSAGLLASGAYAELRVEDTGRGMDAATQARIFDPFFTTKRTGRGLGLAAVQGIVQRHQGAIHVSSTLNSGTSIQVLFPALTTQQAFSAPAGALSAEDGGQLQPSPTAAQLGTVLIIDDEPGVRDVTARLVERLGYHVVVAASGREGVTQLEQGIPDLRGVLLDFNMPGVSGVEVAVQIQTLRPETPLVLMSGYLEEAVIGQLPQSGHLSFLHKPFTRTALTAALAAARIGGART